MSDWLNGVADYFLTLEGAADALDRSIEQIRLFTREGQYAEIEPAAGEMQERLQRLDALIADRQALLQDSHAPAGHRTLRSALVAYASQSKSQAANEGGDAHLLLDQCDELAVRMEQTRQQAIALFVCQYNLSETTDEILRLLFPAADGAAGLATSPHAHRGGRLFDEAG